MGEDEGRWRQTLASLPANAPDVLIVPNVSHPAILTLDTLLAVALTLRGARVHFLMCGEALPACQPMTLQHVPDEEEQLRHGPRRALCGSCFCFGRDTVNRLGFPVRTLRELATDADRQQAEAIARTVPAAQIPRYVHDGVSLGEHALSGAIRFFARGTIDQEPYGERVLRQYLQAALIAFLGARRLFAQTRFHAASLHHGIYVPQGVIAAAGRAAGSRVVTWSMGYRKRAFIFSHGDTYHKTMLNEPVSNWEDMAWSSKAESDVVTYLKDRASGAQDWITYNPNGESRRDEISRQLGMDLSKPTIGLLTNVMWDAQLFYSSSVFENMLEWIKLTIEHFERRPDVQLLIRIHPAELQGQPTRQPVMEEIRRTFPTLPKNVFLIPPESAISTYAAMAECDSVLIYGTKTGVELTSFGIPVIVAGEAWVRNKGVTNDISSKQHYQQVLSALPSGRRLGPDQVERARKYAYHYFFRRMIPIGAVKPSAPGSWSPYELDVKSLDQLGPKGDPGLDVICAGILEGREFTYLAEQIPDSWS
jgi:hypothetical protein